MDLEFRARSVTLIDVGGDERGLSRRQFLGLGAGTAIALWAGIGPRRAPGSSVHVDVDDAASPIGVDGFRRPPFVETFADDALPAWNVRRPVAILGATAFGTPRPANSTLDRSELLQGRGTVIGLDGPLAASAGPGLIETVDAFMFEPGRAYSLSFSVAGSHQSRDRLPPSTLSARLPGLGAGTRVTRRPLDDFRTFSLDVFVAEPAVSTIVFSSENAPGQAGLLLESVALVEQS